MFHIGYLTGPAFCFPAVHTCGACFERRLTLDCRGGFEVERETWQHRSRALAPLQGRRQRRQPSH